MRMASKGVSPLIAAVLLIGFTVSIAAMAGPFFTDIMENSQGTQEEQLENIQSGIATNFEYTSASYNEKSSNLDVSFRNSGSESVERFAVTVYGDTNARETFNGELRPGEIQTINISTSSTPEGIRIESLDNSGSMEVNLSEEENFVVGSTPSSPASLEISD